MDSKQDLLKRKANVSDHLANERTFLAWVRTGIAIMGLGFVVVKFTLFINQLFFLIHGEMPPPEEGYSSIIGILLVVIGAVLVLLSFLQYKKLEKHLFAETFHQTGKLSLTVTILFVAMSALLVWYLLASI